MLHPHGAKLDTKIDTQLGSSFQRSELALAVVGGVYKHADYIMQRTNIDEAEFEAIRYSVNKYDFSESPEMHALTLKFK